MAPPKPSNERERPSNLLKIFMDQAQDIDFRDASSPTSPDPGQLMVEGFEISKLFTVIEFALLHSKDEDGILSGLGMMDRQAAIKAINGIFQFEITRSDGRKEEWWCDMRKSGTINRGRAPARPKPDVTLRLADKDMVQLATGQLNPQLAFLRGKIKVKGNIMLGLKMQTVLQQEVGKMSKL